MEAQKPELYRCSEVQRHSREVRLTRSASPLLLVRDSRDRVLRDERSDACLLSSESPKFRSKELIKNYKKKSLCVEAQLCRTHSAVRLCAAGTCTISRLNGLACL